MFAVSRVLRGIKQPYGGFLKSTDFQKITFDDGIKINEKENIHGTLMVLAVNYLTRFILGESVVSVFWVSWWGAYNKYIESREIKYLKTYYQLINEITGLDDKSIINACKLVGFNICERLYFAGYKPVEEINPDKDTIENIRIFVNRCVKFFQEFGPIIDSAFTFEGAYTHIVGSGVGEYLTYDTLLNLKINKDKPRKEQRLQLLMYYIMGDTLKTNILRK